MSGTQIDRTSPRSPPLGRWQLRFTGRCVRLDGRLDVVEAAIVTYELPPIAVIYQLPMTTAEQPAAVSTLTQAGFGTAWVVTDRSAPSIPHELEELTPAGRGCPQFACWFGRSDRYGRRHQVQYRGITDVLHKADG